MIFITGATGLVGSYVVDKLSQLDIKTLSPNRQALNLQNTGQLKSFLINNKITTIIHLAAETNVDLCEISKSHAILVNYEITKIIADFAYENNIRLIYISTSGVLSGKNRYQHSELDTVDPSNFYSLTKWRSEEYIQKRCNNYLIIRAAWMVGETRGENKKFAEKILHQLKNNVPSVQVVSDLYGSLTTGFRLADFIIHNINIKSNDIVHCASKTVASRFHIAQYIKTFCQSTTEVIPVSCNMFPLSAPRGFSEGLTSEIASMKFGYDALTWEDELKAFLTQI
jgi:dTDP-4-dehydrorhamnose reductase